MLIIFVVHCRDGLISKSDMVSYFMSANSKAIRVAFQHDFNETTYFKPTFCAHCAGLVSISILLS